MKSHTPRRRKHTPPIVTSFIHQFTSRFKSDCNPAPFVRHANSRIRRSTVEGATLGLGKILGTCWALTYVALVLGKPRFQPMLDPSLLAVEGGSVSMPALAISGGGSGAEVSSGVLEGPGRGVMVVSGVVGERNGKLGGTRQRGGRVVSVTTPPRSQPTLVL